jgi:hypothetical protein
MTAHALLNVVLVKRPVRKTSKAGKPYLMASARDGKGPDAKWWTIFGFTEAVIETLEAPVEGETFAATGSFEATIWAPEGREPRGNLTLNADAILTARSKPKPKAEKARASPEPRRGRALAASSWAAPARAEVETPRAEKGAADFDDTIPF